MKTLKELEEEWFFLVHSNEGLQTETIKGFKSENVKYFILEFQKYCCKNANMLIFSQSEVEAEVLWRTLRKFKEIFGDFEK